MATDSKNSKDHKSERAKALSNLAAQRAQALANNDSKTASLIQRIILLLEAKK